MLADATSIIVASITGLSVVIGAGLAFAGVVYTVNAQKQPILVEASDGATPESEAVDLRRRLVVAEAERDAWREIALAARTDLAD